MSEHIPFSWTSETWGQLGSNVHTATSGTWMDAEPGGEESP